MSVGRKELLRRQRRRWVLAVYAQVRSGGRWRMRALGSRQATRAQELMSRAWRAECSRAAGSLPAASTAEQKSVLERALVSPPKPGEVRRCLQSTQAERQRVVTLVLEMGQASHPKMAAGARKYFQSIRAGHR